MDEISLGRLESLRDPGLPALQELLLHGDDLWGALGRAPREVRVVQARWRPGHSLAVRYEALPPDPVEPKAGARDDAAPAVAFVAYHGVKMPEDVAVLRGGAGEVALWPIAEDPWLPGMRVALDPAAVREMLAPLRVPRAPVALRLRAYRPGRRAVVEATTGGYRFFVKVLRPGAIERLQVRHRVMEGIVPVPASHGWSPQMGLVVLEGRPGKTLREALAQGDAVPEPRSIAGLLEALPEIGDGLRASTQVQAGVAQLNLVRRLAPETAPLLEGFDLAAAVGPSANTHTVHGDLHEAQLLVEDGLVTGLLDVDTVGRGDPRDDWATFLGHLVVRHQESRGPERERLRRYAREVAELLTSRYRGDGDPHAIDARVAAVVVGLSTGPFAAMVPDWAALVDARVALAAAWLRGEGRRALEAAPDAPDESELIALSRGSHPPP